MKKSTFILGIAISILLCVPVTAATTYQLSQVSYQIVVNGQNMIESDGLPTLNYNGSTYLPLRKVAEAVGANIQWDNSNKSVVISSDKSYNNVVLFSPTSTPNPNQTPVITPTIKITPNYQVKLNGNIVVFDTYPYELNGEVLVGFKNLSESMGLKCEWNAYTKQVTLHYGTKIMIMTVNSDEYILNNETYSIPARMSIINGRAMIPIRCVVESFGGSCEVDLINKIVNICYNNPLKTPTPTPVYDENYLHNYALEKIPYASIILSQNPISKEASTNKSTIDLWIKTVEDSLSFEGDTINTSIASLAIRNANQAVSNYLHLN